MTYRCGVRMRGRVGRGATAFVAAVVLAGCGGSTDPTPTTPAPTSPTVTATPEPSEEPTESPEPTETGDPVGLPPLPEAAKENTPEGAEAFIRYYFDVMNQLHREPQHGVIQLLADGGCTSCEAAEKAIVRLIDERWRFEGDLYAIESLAPIGGGAPGVTRFDARWRGLGPRILSEEGELVETLPAKEFVGVMAAKWEGAKWVFYDSAVSGD